MSTEREVCLRAPADSRTVWTAASRPSSRVEEEPPATAEPSEGRRARKSVNYALPKLNTYVPLLPLLLPRVVRERSADPPFARRADSKMRRPEDYIPTIPTSSHSSSASHGAAHKPRKSTKTVGRPSLGGSGSRLEVHEAEVEVEGEGEEENEIPPSSARARLEESRKKVGGGVKGVGGGGGGAAGGVKIGRRHSTAV